MIPSPATIKPAEGKLACWFIARQHPGESMAEWLVEGMLERLLDTEDATARWLRERAVFYVVPNMNPDGSIRGHLRNNAAGANLKLTDQEMMQTMQEFQRQMAEAQRAKSQQEAAENLEKGNAFLAENGKREGVVTTASGLQYEIVEPGEGPKPSATSKVKVHYHGTTIDDVVFDSSVDRGQPVSFGLNQVIAGWTEGVQLMSPGAKFKFYIPAALGYGTNVRPGSKFGPNATLIFDVELIEIEEP